MANRPIGKVVKQALGLVKKRTSSTANYSSDRPGIDPKEWCKNAGLKKGWKEIDLQRYIAKKLRASGYKLKENVEISLGGGSWCEADIVIYKDGHPWQVLEVKPYLDRGKVIEGMTQARAYTEHLKCTQQPILIGLTPYTDRSYWGGRNAIKTVAHNNVGVVYMNEDANWTPQKEDTTFWDKAGIKLAQIPWKVRGGAIAVLAMWGLLAGWEFTSKVFHPPSKPAQSQQVSHKCKCPQSPSKPKPKGTKRRISKKYG